MADRYNVNNTMRSGNNMNSDDLNKSILSYRRLYDNHLNYLMNIATNLHVFEGLPVNPDTNKPIRSSFFEYLLIINGMAAISNIDDVGLVATLCSIVGTLNVYGEPNELKLTSSSNEFMNNYSIKGLNVNVKKGNFAFFRNDNLCSSLFPFVKETAMMLTTCLYGMDKNIGQQKFPTIIKGTTDTRLTIDHTLAKIDGYEPYVVLKDTQSFDPENAKIFNIDMPYTADKMYQSYTDILNNFFLRVGINMLPNAKKERMLVDEVNSNNQAIESVSDVYLNNRIEGCEVAKALFPELKNLSVRRNNEFITTIENDPEKLVNSVTKGVI